MEDIQRIVENRFQPTFSLTHFIHDLKSPHNVHKLMKAWKWLQNNENDYLIFQCIISSIWKSVKIKRFLVIGSYTLGFSNIREFLIGFCQQWITSEQYDNLNRHKSTLSKYDLVESYFENVSDRTTIWRIAQVICFTFIKQTKKFSQNIPKIAEYFSQFKRDLKSFFRKEYELDKKSNREKNDTYNITTDFPQNSYVITYGDQNEVYAYYLIKSPEKIFSTTGFNHILCGDNMGFPVDQGNLCFYLTQTSGNLVNYVREKTKQYDAKILCGYILMDVGNLTLEHRTFSVKATAVVEAMCVSDLFRSQKNGQIFWDYAENYLKQLTASQVRQRRLPNVPIELQIRLTSADSLSLNFWQKMGFILFADLMLAATKDIAINSNFENVKNPQYQKPAIQRIFAFGESF